MLVITCRRAVPLAVALLSVSNPTVGVMDMLSRLSHDSDQEVAQNAILALGMFLRFWMGSLIAIILNPISSGSQGPTARVQWQQSDSIAQARYWLKCESSEIQLSLS